MNQIQSDIDAPPVAKPSEDVSTQTRTGLRVLVITLALTGFVLSGMLAVMSADPGSAWAQGICSAGGTFDCSHALNSPFAKVIGPINAAHLGLSYFGIHLLWYGFVGIPNRRGRKWQLLLVFVGLLGLFASITYTAIMIWRLPRVCQLCLLVHAVNFALVALGTIAWFRPRIDATAHGTRPSGTMALATLGGGIGLALLAIVAAVGYQNQQAAFRLQAMYLDVVNDIDYIVWDWSRQEQHEIPVNDRDYQIGPADAKHTLVVFSDFDCDKCAAFHRIADQLVNGFAPDIRAVFKHYPVSKKCNPYVRRAFHPGACDAARVFLAAQSKAEDKTQVASLASMLYQNNTRLYTNEYIVNAAGFDWSQIGPLAEQSDSIQQWLSDDIETAHQLGVVGTPTFFLNGKQLDRWMIVADGPRPTPAYKATNRLWETLLGRSLSPPTDTQSE